MKSSIRALGVSALAGVSSLANAAVPAGTEAIFTGVAADFATIAGYGAIVLAAVTGGMIVFKLVKRVANKAT